jgi:molybdopterin converting factor subunit 1
MTITVQLFAVAKQAAGADRVDLQLPEGRTVADVRKALIERLPSLAGTEKHLKFAVGAEYASDATVVRPGDEVACIPPVSGG